MARSAIDEVLQRAYIKSLGYSNRFARTPTLKLAVLCCMDARLDFHEILGAEPGQVHVLRNAGGLASDDMLRSLALSQTLMGTHEVMVIHHTQCALLDYTEEQLGAAVEKASGRRRPYAFGAFTNVDASVAEAVEAIRNCLYLPFREGVRGFVYEIETGKLREVD